MSRCECAKELRSQSPFSPGLVSDDEPIVYVLVEPLSFEEGSVKALKHERLKRTDLSVCRAQYLTGEQAHSLTVGAMISSDQSRLDKGYVWAMSSEIRDLQLVSLRKGAFCVVDDAYEHFPAHAHLGYSNVEDKKNERIQARANLLTLFQRRGIFGNWSGEPFKTVAGNVP